MIGWKSQSNSAFFARISRRQFVAASLATTVAAVGPSHAQIPSSAPGDASEPGTLWWGELMSRDPAKAREFYAAVVGWVPKIVAYEDFTRPPNPGEKEYTIFVTGDQDAAGGMNIEDAEFDAGSLATWLLYIKVADVDEAVRKAVGLGGKLIHGPSTVPDAGRVAIIEDNEGARLGLIGA